MKNALLGEAKSTSVISMPWGNSFMAFGYEDSLPSAKEKLESLAAKPIGFPKLHSLLLNLFIAQSIP